MIQCSNFSDPVNFTFRFPGGFISVLAHTLLSTPFLIFFFFPVDLRMLYQSGRMKSGKRQSCSVLVYFCYIRL